MFFFFFPNFFPPLFFLEYKTKNAISQHWLLVDHTKHPHFGQKSILEIEEEIFHSCIEGGVLACRGSWFRAERDVDPTGLCFRTTFATASQAEMDIAIQRFGKCVRASFGM